MYKLDLNNNIKDISTLSNLKNLKQLYLRDNLIEGITPLINNQYMNARDFAGFQRNCLDINAGSDLDNINIFKC